MGDGVVSAQRMTVSTFRIVVRGNPITSDLANQDYIALKAAETARQTGGTHFVFINAAEASSETPVAAGQGKKSASNNKAYPPTTVYQLIRPRQDTYIRVVTMGPGQPLPPGSFAADEVIQFIGPRVKRPVI